MKKELIDLLKKHLKNIANNDKNKNHLEKTPDRFLKFLDEFTYGYNCNIKDEIGGGVFDIEPLTSVFLIEINNINFATVCIHHLLPFFGTINVSYNPKNKIIGLSKIPRICSILSKRFNLQEDLTKDICQTIYEILEPEYVKVIIQGKHACMSCRGIQSINA